MFTATAVNAAAFNALVRVMPTRNERSLKECLSCFGIMLLAVATGNDDLQPKAETEAEHIYSQIPNPGKGGCAQFYFSHMPQENGIGDIDKLFVQFRGVIVGCLRRCARFGCHVKRSAEHVVEASDRMSIFFDSLCSLEMTSRRSREADASAAQARTAEAAASPNRLVIDSLHSFDTTGKRIDMTVR